MQGTLFRYGPASIHLAYKSGKHAKHLVCLGGLTDGLLFAPYVQLLSQAVEEKGWSLVQAQLSSSYQVRAPCCSAPRAAASPRVLRNQTVHAVQSAWRCMPRLD